MTLKLAINGFGRIGRVVFREAMQNSEVEVVAVNDLTDAAMLAHLLKYDSVHGTLDAEVTAEGNSIFVDGKEIKVFAEKDPAQLPWKEHQIDIVLESTGIFTTEEAASKHIEAGAKKVILSAPGKGGMKMLVMGVNEETYNPEEHHVVSNASCTTNGLSGISKVLNEKFGIKKAMMTTIHSYTNDQALLDAPHSDYRRARAAAESMIPTTTGAAKSVAKVLPELDGKIDGMAIRVPTPNVSLIDLVAELDKDASIEEVNQALKEATENELKGYLEYSELPLVSRDYNGSKASATVDAQSTMALGGNMVKVLAWYDNESGYSARCVDLAVHMYKKGL
ncbi:type I glyceraldehyde-3-phosphate dehydrogenase [Planococcus sp. CP5-4]|uniref:Glyceraldehyde-3-phosphate dehydrogenase n=1 Tax=Planococcus rifietoensis TaxID=200991 RepID=A0A0U2YIS7_9BACL|nr:MULTISPECIES: type I glyceraldehyde-3-phosphate dehydrogenase [Planococcus]MDE4084064.1 type I glyceraldehyde-3-phosphate dehydrogenase [Planococcus maritimus]MDN5709759.1 type I glyceraldehyde-3-phosphate dehydrogenase [Planococcus sp. (in: firmicutes)]ALS74538.1 glyceraldehyde-3-phosphate dehydrogenase [Planococcus rifietoensis]MBU9674197.1 type I glyceraldehyde-3-phosphate dehydrogenase [Planococcus sp. CP5-4_YE]MBV0909984.1 type I glyceraldehyde-3-phosphate dehydrogenase [Planococcus sp